MDKINLNDKPNKVQYYEVDVEEDKENRNLYRIDTIKHACCQQCFESSLLKA
jgi:hypothetical protein